MNTYVIYRVLHIAMVATWFGLVLGLPGSLKRANRRSPEAIQHASREALRRITLSLGFGVLSLVTGLVVIFHLGGFGVVHRNIHTGLGLVVISLIVVAAVTRPAALKLARLTGEAVEMDRARPLIVRIAVSSGVFQLLWLVTLVLMYLR